MEELSSLAGRPYAFMLRYVRRRALSHAAIVTAVLGAVACSITTQYGVKYLVDTLAMARTLLAHRLKRLSLAKVAEYIGLVKGDMIHNVKGMTRADIIANEMWQSFT